MDSDCSSLAFYGLDSGRSHVATIYETMVDWLGSIGHSPNRIALHRKGQPGKLVETSDVDARVKATDFAGVTGLGLYSKDAGTLPSDYWAGFGYADDFLYLSTRSSLAILSIKSMLPLAQRLITELKPAYGIGYTRLSSQGPDTYALGLAQGDIDDLEALNISQWTQAMAARAWEKGLLRAVYPWNFLTQPHLSASVNGLPLQDWIAAASGRGALHPAAAGMSLWEVPAARIPSIRKTLWDAGDVIFDWTRHLGPEWAKHPRVAAYRAYASKE